MASGHVNRTQRPNTWPHRPKLQREDCPCQPGAVHTWHKADIEDALVDVRSSVVRQSPLLEKTDEFASTIS
jgi:hypothetical protein